MKIISIYDFTHSKDPVYKVQKPIKVGSRVIEIFHPHSDNPQKVEHWISSIKKDGAISLKQGANPHINSQV